jgi:hypothetical protein
MATLVERTLTALHTEARDRMLAQDDDLIASGRT